MIQAPRRPWPGLALPGRHPGLAGLGILALAMALALPPIVPVVAIATAAIVTGLVMIHPVAGLYLLVVAVPFQGLRESDAESVQITPTEPLVALLLVATWCAFGLARERRPRLLPLLIPTLVFLVGMALSVNQSTAVLASLKQVIKWLEFLGVYVAASFLLTTRRQVVGLLALLGVMGVVEAGVGLVQAVAKLGPAPFTVGNIWLRAYGTFGQPNPFAGFLNVCLPLLAVVAINCPPGRARRWAWAGTAFIGFGVLASLSRGAFISLGAALAILVAMLWSRGSGFVRWLALATSLALMALTFAPDALRESAAQSVGLAELSVSSVTPQNFSAVQRLVNWDVAQQMFLNNPWFGVGIGNFGENYLRYAPAGWPTPLGHAHNYYFTLAGETGVVGLLTFVYFSVACLLNAWRCAHQQPPGFERAVAVGVLAAWVTVCLHNTVDDVFVHGIPVVLGIIVALPQVVRQIAAPPAAPARRREEPSL